jgi:hypothetical protein
MADKMKSSLRAIEALLLGAGSVWSLFPVIGMHSQFKYSQCSDHDAIESDWRMVGSDLLGAMQACAPVDEREK